MDVKKVFSESNKIMAFAPIEPITINPILRELMAINGAQLVYRPKILPQHLLKAPKWQYWAKIKNISKVKTPSGKPIYDGIQIIARPEDPIGKVVKYIENNSNKMGIQFIDLNFSCPGYKVLPKRRGGDLLKNPEAILKVISKTLKYTSLPISIKIRKGFLNSDNPHRLCSLIYKEFGDNISWIVVNRAPVKMEKVNFSKIKRDVEPFGQAIVGVNGKIPIIANGSIKNFQDLSIIEQNSDVSGFMIGRAALGNQTIFHDILDPKYSDFEASKRDNAQLRMKFEEFFRIFSKYQNGPSSRFCSMGELKKQLFYYIKHYFECQNKQLPTGYGFSKWNEQKFSPDSLIKTLFKIFPKIPEDFWTSWIKKSIK